MRKNSITHRVCKRCGRDLPRASFEPRIARGREDGIYPRCRECRQMIAQERSDFHQFVHDIEAGQFPVTCYHIDPVSGCLLWDRGTTTKGYAEARIHGVLRYVHQLMYELKYGPIPSGCELDHKCRVRHCINPDHLEPVSHAENGRRSPLVTRLTAEQVREIRQLRGIVAYREIAQRYGVSKGAISHVMLRLNWRDVD